MTSGRGVLELMLGLYLRILIVGHIYTSSCLGQLIEHCPEHRVCCGFESHLRQLILLPCVSIRSEIRVPDQ